MKRYLIEYAKGRPGNPAYEMVTELNADGTLSNNRGPCTNFYELPGIQSRLDKGLTNFQYKGPTDKFTFEYQWMNYRSEWIKCDFLSLINEALKNGN